jgi:rhodanese-related sulfurtransferase/DNA-binding MarR family transcriptional regulator
MTVHSGRRFKDAVYDQFARIAKGLASPRRLELLDLLCQGPRTVEQLARQSNISVANTSQHLQSLRAARLVEAEKDGQYVTYRLADEEVCRLFLSLRRVAESRLAEIECVTRDYLEQRGQLEAVDRSVLIERVRSGEVTVLDVRPREEYLAAHIPGAVSVPLADLLDRLRDLPEDRDIIAYCRGPYCVMAVEAVETLRAHGFIATRLDEGVPEWRARGLAVVVGGAPR